MLAQLAGPAQTVFPLIGLVGLAFGVHRGKHVIICMFYAGMDVGRGKVCNMDQETGVGYSN
jgi:hypothetical protein